MQKQEDEKLERRLHQVMEQIQPDEDAKDRMYLEIMRRASVAETPPAKPKPVVSPVADQCRSLYRSTALCRCGGGGSARENAAGRHRSTGYCFSHSDDTGF